MPSSSEEVTTDILAKCGTKRKLQNVNPHFTKFVVTADIEPLPSKRGKKEVVRNLRSANLIPKSKVHTKINYDAIELADPVGKNSTSNLPEMLQNNNNYVDHKKLEVFKPIKTSDSSSDNEDFNKRTAFDKLTNNDKKTKNNRENSIKKPLYDIEPIRKKRNQPSKPKRARKLLTPIKTSSSSSDNNDDLTKLHDYVTLTNTAKMADKKNCTNKKRPYNCTKSLKPELKNKPSKPKCSKEMRPRMQQSPMDDDFIQTILNLINSNNCMQSTDCVTWNHPSKVRNSYKYGVRLPKAPATLTRKSKSTNSPLPELEIEDVKKPPSFDITFSDSDESQEPSPKIKIGNRMDVKQEQNEDMSSEGLDEQPNALEW